MKVSIADKIAFVSILAVAFITASGWIRAITAERTLGHAMRTTYAQPVPVYPAALAAGRADDAETTPMAKAP